MYETAKWIQARGALAAIQGALQSITAATTAQAGVWVAIVIASAAAMTGAMVAGVATKVGAITSGMATGTAAMAGPMGAAGFSAGAAGQGVAAGLLSALGQV